MVIITRQGIINFADQNHFYKFSNAPECLGQCSECHKTAGDDPERWQKTDQAMDVFLNEALIEKLQTFCLKRLGMRAEGWKQKFLKSYKVSICEYTLF